MDSKRNKLRELYKSKTIVPKHLLEEKVEEHIKRETVLKCQRCNKSIGVGRYCDRHKKNEEQLKQALIERACGTHLTIY